MAAGAPLPSLKEDPVPGGNVSRVATAGGDFFFKRKEIWIFIYKLVPFLRHGRATPTLPVCSLYSPRSQTGGRVGQAAPRCLRCQGHMAPPQPLSEPLDLSTWPRSWGGSLITCTLLHVCAHSLRRAGHVCFSACAPRPGLANAVKESEQSTYVPPWPCPAPAAPTADVSPQE